MPPKISCLLVTANGRYSLVEKSITCFCEQTYSNKELIIVNEGTKEYQQKIQNFVDTLNQDIRTVWLNGKYTLGALRNISIGLSNGEYIVQWDDDDWCTPNRLTTQYNYLIKKEALACYLSDQLHYYFSTNTLYWDNWGKYCNGGGLKEYSLIPGTLMVKKDEFYYPSIGEQCKAGEDSVLAKHLLKTLKEKVVLLSGLGYMHMYTFHGGQVYNLEHHMNISRMRCQTNNHMLKNKQKIIDSIQYFKLEGSIKVMGREGLAFVYDT